MADAEAEFERGFDAVETACAGSRQMAGTHHPSQSFATHTVNEPLVRHNPGLGLFAPQYSPWIRVYIYKTDD